MIRKQPGDGGNQHEGREGRHHQPDVPPGEPRAQGHRHERHHRLPGGSAHRDNADGASALSGEMPADARHRGVDHQPLARQAQGEQGEEERRENGRRRHQDAGCE